MLIDFKMAKGSCWLMDTLNSEPVGNTSHAYQTGNLERFLI
jgi:hypothetical protein